MMRVCVYMCACVCLRVMRVCVCDAHVCMCDAYICVCAMCVCDFACASMWLSMCMYVCKTVSHDAII